jgi:hypothetical protein
MWFCLVLISGTRIVLVAYHCMFVGSLMERFKFMSAEQVLHCEYGCIVEGECAGVCVWGGIIVVEGSRYW